jgi:hypothetical protein
VKRSRQVATLRALLDSLERLPQDALTQLGPLDAMSDEVSGLLLDTLHRLDSDDWSSGGESLARVEA